MVFNFSTGESFDPNAPGGVTPFRAPGTNDITLRNTGALGQLVRGATEEQAMRLLLGRGLSEGDVAQFLGGSGSGFLLNPETGRLNSGVVSGGQDQRRLATDIAALDARPDQAPVRSGRGTAGPQLGLTNAPATTSASPRARNGGIEVSVSPALAEAFPNLSFQEQQDLQSGALTLEVAQAINQGRGLLGSASADVSTGATGAPTTRTTPTTQEQQPTTVRNVGASLVGAGPGLPTRGAPAGGQAVSTNRTIGAGTGTAQPTTATVSEGGGINPALLGAIAAGVGVPATVLQSLIRPRGVSVQGAQSRLGAGSGQPLRQIGPGQARLGAGQPRITSPLLGAGPARLPAGAGAPTLGPAGAQQFQTRLPVGTFSTFVNTPAFGVPSRQGR